MIEIILADDHALITDGLNTMLNDVDDIEVIGACRNGQEVINLLNVKRADIVILDIDMPVMDGIATAKVLAKDFPNQRFAMLTMHNEPTLIRDFVQMGASGYFVKTIDKEEFVLAIRQMAKGKKYFPFEVMDSLANNNSTTKAQSEHGLSERELEIIKLLADGLTNKQIGEKIFISPRTVDTHRTNIMRKIDANNVAGIIRFAYKNRLIEP